MKRFLKDSAPYEQAFIFILNKGHEIKQNKMSSILINNNFIIKIFGSHLSNLI